MFRSIAVALAISFTAIPAAHALEVDFSTVLYDDTGTTPLWDCEKFEDVTPPAIPRCLQKVDLTLSRVALAVLNTAEQGVGPDESIRRGLLARAIRRQPKQNLSIDDVKMLSDLIMKRGFAPVVILDVIEVLDPGRIKK